MVNDFHIFWFHLISLIVVRIVHYGILLHHIPFLAESTSVLLPWDIVPPRMLYILCWKSRPTTNRPDALAHRVPSQYYMIMAYCLIQHQKNWPNTKISYILKSEASVRLCQLRSQRASNEAFSTGVHVDWGNVNSITVVTWDHKWAEPVMVTWRL